MTDGHPSKYQTLSDYSICILDVTQSPRFVEKRVIDEMTMYMNDTPPSERKEIRTKWQSVKNFISFETLLYGTFNSASKFLLSHTMSNENLKTENRCLDKKFDLRPKEV